MVSVLSCQRFLIYNKQLTWGHIQNWKLSDLFGFADKELNAFKSGTFSSGTTDALILKEIRALSCLLSYVPVLNIVPGLTVLTDFFFF